MAANTLLPVIGVPLASGALAGWDALLATVQMPPGIPVATVAVDGARNAAFLAARILAVAHPPIRERLQAALDKDRQALQRHGGAAARAAAEDSARCGGNRSRRARVGERVGLHRGAASSSQSSRAGRARLAVAPSPSPTALARAPHEESP